MKVKEPFSGFSHLTGAILSAGGLIILLKSSLGNGDVYHIVSFTVYGISMILLYSASAFYHLLDLNEKGTRIMKTLDHVMIYLLIAGTYTPFCLIPLRGAGVGVYSELFGEWLFLVYYLSCFI